MLTLRSLTLRWNGRLSVPRHEAGLRMFHLVPGYSKAPLNSTLGFLRNVVAAGVLSEVRAHRNAKVRVVRAEEVSVRGQVESLGLQTRAGVVARRFSHPFNSGVGSRAVSCGRVRTQSKCGRRLVAQAEMQGFAAQPRRRFSRLLVGASVSRSLFSLALGFVRVVGVAGPKQNAALSRSSRRHRPCSRSAA